MNKFTLLIGLFIWSINAHAVDAKGCISLSDERGNHCGSPDSTQVRIRNNCPVKIYLKLCLEKTNGQWDCTSDSSFAPGEAYNGGWTCHGTGRYQYAACTGGYSECGFKP